MLPGSGIKLQSFAFTDDNEIIIIKIVNNEHGAVRSCAIGALGYLKAENISEIILKLISDSSLEVQISALNAAIQTKISIPEQKIKEISKNDDVQIKNLLLKLKK